MKLKEFYNEVAKQADTETLQINAAEVSRVLRVAGDILAELKGRDLVDLLDDWFEKD